MRIIAVAGAVLVGLTVAKGLAPEVLYFLPLGGSAIAELGIVLGSALFLQIFIDLICRNRSDGDGYEEDTGYRESRYRH